MAAKPSLPSVILKARERLREGRVRLRAQHESGSPGLQLTHLQTDLVDGIILDLFATAVEDLKCGDWVSQVALVAHGGYGRRDLAPFSDCDLMLVPTAKVERQVQGLAARLSRDIVDAGLQLGFSVRRPDQACHWAWRDPTIYTSLSESRFLTGSVHVFSRFFEAFRHGAMRRQRRLIKLVFRARREERAKWGETSYLLRPNVKRSRGGLRDIQLIRWLGFARYGDSDLDKLLSLGALSEDDYQRLRKALAFLLRLRNELHFDSGKSQDILDRPAQMRIATRWGYKEEPGCLPVESFMRDYFEHTREVRYVSAHFVDTVKYPPLTVRSLDILLSKRIADDFRIGPYHIWIRESRLQDACGDITRVMRLMELANRYQRRISHRTWQAIREEMRDREIGVPPAEANQLFIALLNNPGHLADLLRRLHELRVLEQIIPAMRHARCLLQFNEYHKYTVDAHSIRAVEAAAQFADERSELGDVYRSLKQPWLLHLSLLIHDLGKGYDCDHSIKGREIAAETATRLGLSDEDSKMLQHLVLQHLVMIHTALRHDLSDIQIIAHFGDTIETVEALDMLFVHSICDLIAVGPDVLTDWKRKLILELYQRARLYLLEGKSVDRTDQRIVRIRALVKKKLQAAEAPDNAFAILQMLPHGLLDGVDQDQIVHDVLRAAKVSSDTPVQSWGRPLPEEDATEYYVVFQQGERRIGLFMAIVGALLSQGLEVMRSQIETLDTGLAWDQFVVRDLDFDNPTPASRIRQVCQAIEEALLNPSSDPPKFRRNWTQETQLASAELRVLPCRVKFDNETTDSYTILSIYAYDRPGLLYALARVIAANNLVIHFAKIGSSYDQAVDVFYVTEATNTQVIDPERQSLLEMALIEAAQ